MEGHFLETKNVDSLYILLAGQGNTRILKVLDAFCPVTAAARHKALLDACVGSRSFSAVKYLTKLLGAVVVQSHNNKALCQACTYGKDKVVKLLLEGQTLEKLRAANSLFQRAVESSSTKVVQALLGAGMDRKDVQADNYAALYCAVAQQNPAMVRMLLAALPEVSSALLRAAPRERSR